VSRKVSIAKKLIDFFANFCIFW